MSLSVCWVLNMIGSNAQETQRSALSSSLAHLTETGPGSPNLDVASRSTSMKLPMATQSRHRSPRSPALEPVSLAFNDAQGPDTPPGASPCGKWTSPLA
jgi:hypothetical protein